jgi:hypothetical protein
MLKSSELESMLNGVDGAIAEHPEVDHPTEVKSITYSVCVCVCVCM